MSRRMPEWTAKSVSSEERKTTSASDVLKTSSIFGCEGSGMDPAETEGEEWKVSFEVRDMRPLYTDSVEQGGET